MANFESKGPRTRAGVASFLREFADKLDDGGSRAERGRWDSAVAGGDAHLAHREEVARADHPERSDEAERVDEPEPADDAARDEDAGRTGETALTDDTERTDDPDRAEDGDRDDESLASEAGAREPKHLTLIVGGDSATVTVPETIDFDIEVDSSSPMLSSAVKQQIEFRLAWKVEEPAETGDEQIRIE